MQLSVRLCSHRRVCAEIAASSTLQYLISGLAKEVKGVKGAEQICLTGEARRTQTEAAERSWKVAVAEWPHGRSLEKGREDGRTLAAPGVDPKSSRPSV